MRVIYANSLLKAPITDPEHLVNKHYVDSRISRRIKEPVRVVCTDNFGTVYNAADDTIEAGKTYKSLIQSPAGPLVIDGITLALNDRVLLAGQTDQSQNGIYVVKKLNEGYVASHQKEDGSGNPLYYEVTIDEIAKTYTVTTNEVTASSATFAGDPTDEYESTGSEVEKFNGGDTINFKPVMTDIIPGDPAILVRAEDFDQSFKIWPNVIIPVSEGKRQGDITWQLVNDTQPNLDGEALVFGAYKDPAASSAYAADFTVEAGEDPEWEIVHGLESTDVLVQVYDENGCECVFDIKKETKSMIKIIADALPTVGSTFRVIIVG